MAARKQNTLIFVTIVGCVLSLIICGISFGTNQWFESRVSSDPTAGQISASSNINFGLFKGRKIKSRGNSNFDEFDLKIVCEKAKSCMFSCGKTAELRKNDLSNLTSGDRNIEETDFCDNGQGSVKLLHINGKNTEGYESTFLNFGLWVCTCIFLACGMAFAFISGVQALYNTFRSPSSSIFSVFGLYIWNGIAAFSIFLTLIIWGAGAFQTNLKKDSAVRESLTGIYRSEFSDGFARLGYSFWILLGPFFLHLINIAVIFFRSYKIKQMNKKNVKVIKEVVATGETLLF